MINAIFKPLDTEVYTNPAKQWDYGQILRIQGVTLPKAVEVHFGISGEENTVPSVGVTDGDHTDVEIPDGLLRQPNDLVAYVYIADVEKGNTVKTINIPVIARAKPAIPHTPEDEAVFREAIEAVNTAADRAEKAGQTATEAAGQAAEDAQQTAEDRKEVEKMVETVSDISEQVKKVEQLSQQAQDAATKAGKSEQAADGFKTQAESAKKDAEAAAVKTAEDKTAVENAKTEVLEVKTEVNADRTVVEQIKNEVEQLGGSIAGAVQSGVQEITQAGAAQKTAVEGAGTQAVESVDNVKASATTAVETVKTEAVQSVQTEGNTQTGNVTTEGTKQVKAVRDEGQKVLQSIPEDFQTQMETKLNKQQGIENKGKVLVIGEDGNVVPEEVASGGGDGIAIVNTTSGESPLVIPDSAERVNKGLEFGRKTEQVQTTGAQLFDIAKCPLEHNGISFKIPKSSGDVVLMDRYVFEENTQYTISAQKTTSKNENSAVFKFEYADGSRNEIKVKDIAKKSLTSMSGKTVKRFLVVNPFGAVDEVFNFQFEKGVTATPYEPYTGGKPSPSPEYPQEIKNSGKWNEETQKYEVDVKVTGKNLLNLQKEPDVKGTYQGWKVWNGESLTLGVKDKGNNADIKGCYIGFSDQGSESKGVVWVVDNGVIKMNPLTQRKSYVSIFPANETTVKKLTERLDIQCELGNVATPYQPYKEQTITLTSDRPLTKWDRLVEQGGQIGWLYNSVNETIDGKTGKWSIQPANKIFYRTDITFPIVVPFCIELLGYDYSMRGYKKDTGITINNLGILCITLPEEVELTLDAYKQYLADNPLHVLYKGDSEEFVPLPQSEQNAIRALKTYYPTTVITADGGELDPDIKVTYTADTKNYIDNKVSAKVASIIRQYRLNTANLLSLMPMETQAAMIENDTNNILENVEEMKHE